MHIGVQQVVAAAVCSFRLWANLADRSAGAPHQGLSQCPRIMQV